MSFEIESASRKDAKVCVQFAGLSGSGKTYSALAFARGLVGEYGKIGFIDTEQKRASLYSDKFGGFKVINMDAPFSPDRFIEAIKVFKDAGYGCVIIDSMSHEWEGVGGILEMADNQKYGNGKAMVGLSKWNVPKAKHKKMMNYMLQCGMHVLACYRAKKPMEEVFENGKKIMREGALQICAEHKNIYDITVSLILDEDTKFPAINKKCPEDIEFLFRGDKFISEESGAVVNEWLHTPCKDKHELKKNFEESGLEKGVWFETLNKFEQYIARKHKQQILGE